MNINIAGLSVKVNENDLLDFLVAQGYGADIVKIYIDAHIEKENTE